MKRIFFSIGISSIFFLTLTSHLPKGFSQTTQPAPAERVDLLDIANGAVVLSKSSEYGGAQWSALALLDGTPSLGWCSANNAQGVLQG